MILLFLFERKLVIFFAELFRCYAELISNVKTADAILRDIWKHLVKNLGEIEVKTLFSEELK